MKRGVAFPFLTLGDGSLRAGNWQIFLDGQGPLDSQDHIADWDYASGLRVYRSIEVDLQSASEALSIPPECLELTLIVSIATGPGGIPRIVESLFYPVSGVAEGRIEIDHSVDSAMLSRRLKLITEIVLGSAPERHSQLSPTLPGSRLWKDDADLRLEGQEPRFPMEVISFGEHFRDRAEAGSLWYLQWNPADLQSDFRGAVRLYLNADRQEFVDRIYDNDRAALQLLVAGVVSLMVERTLADPDLEDIILEGISGSVAWHTRNWLSLAFPGMKMDQVRSILEQRPGQFHAAIQGLSDVVGGQP